MLNAQFNIQHSTLNNQHSRAPSALAEKEKTAAKLAAVGLISF
jgi:hypothetical protein